MGKDFENKVREGLSGFSRGDICFFAWLCAVRTLPFLVVNRNFDYWKRKDVDNRQKHLFSVLHAIDAAYAARTAAARTAAARTATAYAARTAADANAAAADAADAYAAYAARTAAYAARTADTAYAARTTDTTYAARTAEATAYAARTAADAADANAAAAVYAADAYAAYDAQDVARSAIDLKSILVEDLEIIEAGRHKFKSDTAVYGSIWDNFQSALRDLGCEYWSDWYADVFAKGFTLNDKDREEIELRLSVPPEIMNQGAADVARYVLELKEQGIARLNETRVIILGNKGSGKTSLARRLQDPANDLPLEAESTEGVDVIEWIIPVDPSQHYSGVNAYVWDFAGHVITHAVHPCFMSERCLYILVVDGRTEGDGRTEYWLEQIRNYGKDSPVLVLINARDKHVIDLPKNTLKNTFPSIAGFYEVNLGARDGELEAFRQVVMDLLRDTPLWKNQKISAPAYKVKNNLRQKFRQGTNYINRKDFDQIAKNNGIKPEEQTQLLKDLKDLGICLWYDNVDMGEFNTMVLNPGWISHGIYRLINWGLHEKISTISISNFLKAFTGKDADKYPEGKAGFLFRLMETYELAFFKDKDILEIFVPLLRPVDRPTEGLPVFEFGERLRMEYCANQALPPYTVARLAVRHSAEWKEVLSWRFGAVLNWEGTEALVVMENEHAHSVTVSVKGPKQTEYISILRTTLNDIFKVYESNFPELKYEVLEVNAETNQADRQLLPHNDSNECMQTETQIIKDAIVSQELPTGTSLKFLSYAKKAIDDYGLSNSPIFINCKVKITNFHINILFKNCSVNLQGELNALAQRFNELGTSEADELAKELTGVASDVNKIIKEIPANITVDSSELEEVKCSLRSKGLLNRLENFYDEMCDKNSDLHKNTVKVLKSIQKLGSHYNNVAQWVGLPQIPRPFLETFGKKG